MKPKNGVFVVFKTKHELRYQFPGNTSPLLRFFDELLTYNLMIRFGHCKNTALLGAAQSVVQVC